ncbi:MAG: hypothetical protein M1834_009017 [Cirrosporium novae-zelandiae]|nr:MAG: hypothetical protein M1834_009017 [Cirrosporium novae-zelandiae]
MEKSYENAIGILNSRRREARPKSEVSPRSRGMTGLTWMPSLNGAPSLRGMPSLVGMREWLQQLGHSDADVDSLNVIHIAGTKGKGSTCAFVESFLRIHGNRTGFPRKTGLYTSPHLIFPEERIRINFEPLSKEFFAKYFFEVYDSLSQQSSKNDFESAPRYLQLLALVSFHTFIREGVDVAIYETHNGGKYDATNVIQRPVVTAVTPIGEDHVNQLGPSIENIAWHKAGIFKTGVPAFSAPQELAVDKVLRIQAAEKGVELKFVNIDSSLPGDALQLKPEVQRMNCSLAHIISDAFLRKKAPEEYCSLTSHDILQGIEQFSWQGRFQLIRDGNSNWFLDGAHNKLSIKESALWFAKASSEMRSNSASVPRALIFSQISDQRNGSAVLECLANSLQQNGIRMQHVVFTTYKQTQDSTRNDQPLQMLEMPDSLYTQYNEVWGRIDPNAKISREPTIDGALRLVKRISDQNNGVQVLVTGSLHLVGGALCLLAPNASVGHVIH